MSCPESPLLCQDQRAGEAHLIHWFTTYDRGKLIVVRDAETAAAVLREKVKEHPLLTVLDALRIRFVAPNEVMAEEASALALADAIREFQYHLGSRCDSAERLGLHSLIPPFCKPCRERPRKSKEEHLGCGKCFCGFVFENVEKVYAEKGAAFRSKFPQYEKPAGTRTASKAEPLRARARSYYVAADRSGPHSDGVALIRALAPKKPRHLRWQMPEYSSDVFFRFELLGKLALDWLPAFQAEAKADVAKADEEERQQRRASSEQEERESTIAALKSLL